MGSVPAISVLVLGIVVPALAGYIEVCHPERVFIPPSFVVRQVGTDLDRVGGGFAHENANLSRPIFVLFSHEAFMADPPPHHLFPKRIPYFISPDVTV